MLISLIYLNEIHLHTKLAGRMELKDGSCLSLLFCFDRCHANAIRYWCSYCIYGANYSSILVQQ